MLLVHGANVHIRDGDGWTPLEVAKWWNGHEEFAKLLSERRGMMRDVGKRLGARRMSGATVDR